MNVLSTRVFGLRFVLVFVFAWWCTRIYPYLFFFYGQFWFFFFFFFFFFWGGGGGGGGVGIPHPMSDLFRAGVYRITPYAWPGTNCRTSELAGKILSCTIYWHIFIGLFIPCIFFIYSLLFIYVCLSIVLTNSVYHSWFISLFLIYSYLFIYICIYLLIYLFIY